MCSRRQKSAGAHGFDVAGLRLFFFQIQFDIRLVIRAACQALPVQPDDGQGGPGSAAHQNGGPGKRERVHLK